MADGHSHLIDFPEAIEVLLARLGELKIVLGPAAAPGGDRIAETLRAGLAARERGDVPAAVQPISQAMQELAALAAHAEEAAEVMRARSGSVLHAKKPGWEGPDMRPSRGVLVFCLAVALLSAAADGNTQKETQNMPKGHFVVVSSARKPAPGEIAAHLEPAWQTFHDVFGVDPAPVKVVVSVTAGAGAPPSQADPDRSGGAPAHEIAWAIKEGEPLSSQSFSDLAHEITHIYFIDYMGDQGGLHQAHAWLHEAVACYAERDPFRRNREQWARDHLSDRIPLAQLFTMTNPQKTNPLVELTVKLQEQLARGEIKVEDMNRQIADFATTHATELSQAGIRNMTYYSESLSLFEFLLQTEGKAFLRTMCQALKAGKSMDDVLRSSKAYPRGIPQLEEAWVAWVQKG